jgi:hypothetical protein
MAKTIPQLTDATTVNAADELIVQQGGITKRATGAELAKGLNTINGTGNVKDFGAVGNGVADDTAALQAAVNGSRRLFIPPGITVRVLSRITLPSNIYIFGGGRIVAGPVAGFAPLPTTHIPMLYAEEQNNIDLENIELDISAWANTTGGGTSNFMMAVMFRRGVNVNVRRCSFVTVGGATAHLACKDYDVTDNHITCVDPVNQADGYADGVIDNWTEFNIDAERFEISGNVIRGGGYARWGIMVTADLFLTFSMDVYNVVISNNIIVDTFYDGIWAFGRDAEFRGWSIEGNVISGVRHGIRVSDASRGVIVGNVVKNARENGISLFSEGLGPAVAVSGCIVANNQITNAGTVAPLISAITVLDGSTNNTFTGNQIRGTSQAFGFLFDDASSDNLVNGNFIDPCPNGKIREFGGSVNNRIDGADYTPVITLSSDVSAVAIRRASYTASATRVDVCIHADVSATGAAPVFTISLPVAHDVTTYGVSGVVSINGGTGIVGADAPNDQAYVAATVTGAGSYAMMIQFSYNT